MRKRRKQKAEATKSKKPLFDLEDATKKAIWGILFLSFAAVVFLSLWHKAGPFGELVSRFFNYLFGWGYVILPLIFLVIGFEMLRSKRRHVYFATFFGAFLFLVSLLGIINFFAPDSGGLAGLGVSRVLGRFLGFWGSLVMLFSFLAVSVLMTLNIPFRIGRDDDDDDEKTVEEEESGQVENDEDGLKKVHSQSAAVIKPAIVKSAEASFLSKKTSVDDDENDLEIPRNLAGRTYNAPDVALLEDEEGKPSTGDIKASANIIRRTLEHFGIEVEMGEVSVGPTITQYTLRPAQGIKLSKIVALHNDLALALAAHPLRIEAPIPGKALVGIEVPNKTVALVRLRSLLDTEFFNKAESSLTFSIGRDVSGSAFYGDLAKMPHLLIAGSTGSGKSVCIHSLLTSLLWRNGPGMLKFIMIDPKRVELSHYNGIPHLLTPVIHDGKRAINTLRWAVKEMERRYEILSDNGFRDIIGINHHAVKTGDENIMPYIVIVIDELADLMSAYGREVEGTVIRLAQMARAVGIHLVVSTQRPSVEVITGLIKANITTRVAFQVASQVDSRTILDMAGAEKLLGNGDMLYLAGDASKPKRIQGVYISEREIKKISDFIKKNNQNAVPEYAPENGDQSNPDSELNGSRDMLSEGFLDDDRGTDDEMYGEAKQVVVEAQKASASLLQRRLRVGYARAARLLDMLEAQGVIGPGDGAKPREVHIKNEVES